MAREDIQAGRDAGRKAWELRERVREETEARVKMLTPEQKTEAKMVAIYKTVERQMKAADAKATAPKPKPAPRKK
jgi:hypothetical protein